MGGDAAFNPLFTEASYGDNPEKRAETPSQLE